MKQANGGGGTQETHAPAWRAGAFALLLRASSSPSTHGGTDVKFDNADVIDDFNCRSGLTVARKIFAVSVAIDNACYWAASSIRYFTVTTAAGRSSASSLMDPAVVENIRGDLSIPQNVARHVQALPEEITSQSDPATTPPRGLPSTSPRFVVPAYRPSAVFGVRTQAARRHDDHSVTRPHRAHPP